MASKTDQKALGIHISVLMSICQKPELDGLTTEDVCAKLIKPATLDKQCAYIDLLHGETAGDGTPSVGPATCFVSHAWKCTFRDVVNCLVDYTDKHPNTYLFLVRSGDQQPTQGREQRL